jgi:hypothetical protein
VEPASKPEERVTAPVVTDPSPEPAAALPVETRAPEPVLEAAPASVNASSSTESSVAAPEVTPQPASETLVERPTEFDASTSLANQNGNRWGFASRAFKAAKKLLSTELVLYPQTEPPPMPALSEDALASSDAPAQDEATVEAPQVATPALCGHSSVLAVPEVLGLLANLHKSGNFSVWNDVDAYRIHLVDGNVVSAQVLTANSSLVLGRILVDHGALAEATLTQFLEEHPNERRRLGAALIEAGHVDENAIASAIAYQAQRVFHAAYDLRDAWYRFDVDREVSRHERGLSVTHLLLESARMRDETEQRLSDVFDDPFAA